MEIVLVVFLGVWISAAGLCAYFWLKREYEPFLRENKQEGADE